MAREDFVIHYEIRKKQINKIIKASKLVIQENENKYLKSLYFDINVINFLGFNVEKNEENYLKNRTTNLNNTCSKIIDTYQFN